MITKTQFRKRLRQLQDDAEQGQYTSGLATAFGRVLELLEDVEEWDTTPAELRSTSPLISLTEGATRLGCDRSWIYRHRAELHKLERVRANEAMAAPFGLPAGPLRRPLRAFEGARLEAGLEIAARLGLDEKYGFNVKPQVRSVV